MKVQRLTQRRGDPRGEDPERRRAIAEGIGRSCFPDATEVNGVFHEGELCIEVWRVWDRGVRECRRFRPVRVGDG